MGSAMRGFAGPKSRFMLPAWLHRQYCLSLHLISVRTDLVRPECYYILCLKAS